MDGPDELFNLRNAFHLGNYQMAINEALSVNSSSDVVRAERDFYMYRSYIEQGNYSVVLDEVQDSAPTTLRAVKLLASYLQGGNKEVAKLTLAEWLSDSSAMNNPNLVLIAGVIYTHEEDYKEALKWTHQGTTLELMALVAQIYIAMNRPDLADKQVALMQQQDDDATLTQLAVAWSYIAKGMDKFQEAFYIFQELAEKYNTSSMLLNNMAICQMHMGKHDEAEKLLQEALQKDSKDANTLANLIVCFNHLRKPQDVIQRYANQLKTVAPDHPWVTKCAVIESSFDRCAAQNDKTSV